MCVGTGQAVLNDCGSLCWNDDDDDDDNDDDNAVLHCCFLDNTSFCQRFYSTRNNREATKERSGIYSILDPELLLSAM